MKWYTCKNCPPHGLQDHAHYGKKECLATDCPCTGYTPNDKEPENPPRKKPSFGSAAFLPKP